MLCFRTWLKEEENYELEQKFFSVFNVMSFSREDVQPIAVSILVYLTPKCTTCGLA